MKVLFILIFLASCGIIEGPKGSNGRNGSNCIVEEKNDKAIIKCGDGSSYVVEDGEDGINGEDGVDGQDGSDGQDGEDGINGEDGEDFTPTKEPSFAGYYILPYGGYIELIETFDKRIYIYGTQRIYSKNYDKELAFHPYIPSGPHYVKSGVINGEYSTHYDSDTNDLEEDGTTHNITDRRKTVYTIKIVNDRLRINLKVYDEDGLEIECNRTITSRK